MKGIQFKMILRGFKRNKVYTLISVLSLIIGLTVSILVLGFVTTEYRIARNYDSSGQWFLLKGKNQFYTLTEVETKTSTLDLSPELKDKYPEVLDFCVFHGINVSQMGEEDNKPDIGGAFEVSPIFGEAFPQKVLYGDLVNALKDDNGMIITSSFAGKVFGRHDVIGQEMNLLVKRPVTRGSETRLEYQEETKIVRAVVDDSQRSFLKFTVLLKIPESEFTPRNISFNNYYSFVCLQQGIDVKEFEKKVNNDFDGKRSVRFLPMEEVYFDRGGEDLFFVRDNSLLYMGMTLGIVVLVIACFNYININLTQTFQRMRQIGQQMLFGASRNNLRMQLICEAAIQVVVAFMVAMMLIELLLPMFNNLLNARIRLSDFFAFPTWTFLLLLLAVVTFVPSLYIFLRMGKKDIHLLLKQENRSRAKLITGMVIAQFTLSIILLIFVFMVHKQMDFVAYSNKDADRIISVNPINKYDREKWDFFKSQLHTIPEVKEITEGGFISKMKMMTQNHKVSVIQADTNYFSFYGLEFLEGAPFPHGSEDVVVNETFVKTYELENPIGEKVYKKSICGVVRDFVFEGHKMKIEPLVIEEESGIEVIVKAEEGMTEVMKRKLEQLWHTISSGEGKIKMQTMAENFLQMHKEDEQMKKMILFLTWISMLLTLLGLFGLAGYSVQIRSKEIALRKVNGATIFQVISLLCYRFLAWISIAFLIAVPIAYYFSSQWLAEFVYRINISVGVLVGIGIMVLSIGLLTVIWQSWHAARRNPVHTLRVDV